jgi:hypothetical protein
MPRKPALRSLASTKRRAAADLEIPMLSILYRPMVKEALILILSGVVATTICSHVYAAPASGVEQAVQTTSATPTRTPTPLQGRLAPVPQDQAREMLLAPMRGQGPLAGATPEAAR